MTYQLINEQLEVTINSVGAEITSIKNKEGLEYIWCGDKKYWGRHTPVLFPIVGKVLDNEYTCEGKTYAISQHGFARDHEFKVISYDNPKITLALTASTVTLEKYPFDFELRITYTLKERAVVIKYEVINNDSKEMPFSIGAHPAFNCPLLSGEVLEDYYIEFEQLEEMTKLIASPQVYLTGERQKLYAKKLPLNKAFFKDDAVILTDIKSQHLAIKSEKNDHSIVVACSAFPFLGIWQPVQGAPFVCIEPWYGHTDYLSDSKEMAEKKDVILLEPSSRCGLQYDITFN